jgi:thiamine-phosphate pyrophosphorylase
MARDEPVTCRLYLITPPDLVPASFADILAAALDAGDVACVQLRLKDVPDDVIRRTCDMLLPVAQSRDVAFILNDRPDLALAAGCDGVHIGQQDMPYKEARRLLGADRIVGVTCHDDPDLAIEAAEMGADYVAFGAFFPSGTKETKHRPSPEILRWWSDATTVPVVAIGGITPENCGPLVTAGADFLAVSGAVWTHEAGAAAAVREFNRAISAAHGGDPP